MLVPHVKSLNHRRIVHLVDNIIDTVEKIQLTEKYGKTNLKKNAPSGIWQAVGDNIPWCCDSIEENSKLSGACLNTFYFPLQENKLTVFDLKSHT